MLALLLPPIVIIIFIVLVIALNRKVRNKNIGNTKNRYTSRVLDDNMRMMQDTQQRMFMEESLKNVTPIEHGGYDMN